MATILVVEDDMQIRTAYVFALTHAGHSVKEASDGATALELLTEETFDVILLDMLMPGVSGIEFLRQGRIKEKYPNTVVFAFSNIDSPRVVNDAKELGVTEYIIKIDMTPHQMVDRIQQQLEGSAPTEHA